MSATYNGNPANITPNYVLTIEEPTDGDARNASSVNNCLSPIADMAEFCYEMIAAQTVSRWDTVSLPAGAASNNDDGLVYGNGHLMLGGAAGATTTDPRGTWSSVTGTGASFARGIYSTTNSLFVLSGNSGAISTSSNGTSATVLGTNTGGGQSSIACNANGSLIVITDNSAGHAWTSANGTAWTDRGVVSTGFGPRTLTFGAGLFVAAGASNVFTSPDGITWTSRSVSGLSSNSSSVLQCFGGVFVLMTNTGGVTKVYNSVDGINWSAGATWSASSLSIRGIAHNERMWVAGYASGVMMSSIDGVNWKQRGAGLSASLATWNDIIGIPQTAVPNMAGMFVGINTTPSAFLTTPMPPL